MLNEVDGSGSKEQSSGHSWRITELGCIGASPSFY
uniref:Uncharacterized protein n=1 Tax=Anguilla anguilla TaxID=7936 RepID=A0A0E9R3R4_ANGAN